MEINVIDGGTVARQWSADRYCLAGGASAARLAELVYARVFRADFSAPGFCLIDFGPQFQSQALRRTMLDLKRALEAIHRRRASRNLTFVSLARFDQQVTTKLHRDGGPDESLLMLGYEPSSIRSEVAIADYSACAHDLGLTPSELLAKHNPMFGPGAELLKPYTTPVACLSNERFQILCVNNSVAPYTANGTAWQGVLHTATIVNPSDDILRVVNSFMLASAPLDAKETIGVAEREAFATTTVVHRRGYDKLHLDDEN